jgi:hypothetical protein
LELGNYPLVCRVERIHTEFPPDPYTIHKVVDKTGKETTLTWNSPEQKKRKKKKNKLTKRRFG